MASPRRRSRRSSLPFRVVVLCGVALVLFLYYRPVKSYLSTAKELSGRRAEVSQLRAQQRSLQHRLALSSTQEELSREARRLGYVRPAERLYIVKGIDAWRARQAAAAKAAAKAARIPGR
jgi:hypothetical protein